MCGSNEKSLNRTFREMQAQMMQQQQEQLAKMQEQAMKRQEEEFKRMQESFFRKASEAPVSDENQRPFKEPQVTAKSSFTCEENNSKSGRTIPFLVHTEDSNDTSDKKSSLLEDTAYLLQANSRVSSKYLTIHCCQISNPSHQQGHPISVQRADSNPNGFPSPTVNTKEALSLVQKMWGGAESDEAGKLQICS